MFGVMVGPKTIIRMYLTSVQNDKSVTAHQIDNLNSTVAALSQMRGCKLFGQPIDLAAYKESIPAQMDELVASGAARERRVAQFVTLTASRAEKPVVEATHVPTVEATAMVMEGLVEPILQLCMIYH